MTVGKNIKLFRINAGLKQKDLAAEIGVKESYLSTIESGKKEPSLNLLKKIASALGIPLSMFFWEEIDNLDQNTSEAKLKRLLLQLTAEIKPS
jgi:transcriptional regulator with XRE-family HTH domain